MKLFVFDFHGVLSLSSRELNSGVKKRIKAAYPGQSPPPYLEGLKTLRIPVEDVMPTFSDVSAFTDQLEDNQHVGVASAAEFEGFMFAVLEYCYTRTGLRNPFREDIVLSGSVSKFENREIVAGFVGKMQHIALIKHRLGTLIQNNEIMLIDDEQHNLDIVSKYGVQGWLVRVLYFQGLEYRCIDAACKRIARYHIRGNPRMTFCGQSCLERYVNK